MANTYETTGQRHELAIGRQKGDSESLVGIFVRRGGPPNDEIHLHLQNHGTEPFTFTAIQGRVAVGSVTLTAQPADDDTLVINDGINAAVTFQFDDDASVTETATLRQVVLGATVGLTASNLLAAIAAAPALNIEARLVRSVPGDAFIELISTVPDDTNTALSGTNTGGVQVRSGLSGGTGVTQGLRIDGADAASVTVVPGGRVNATIELAIGDPSDYLSFYATGADGIFGEVTVVYFHGELTPLSRWADYIDPALEPTV